MRTNSLEILNLVVRWNHENKKAYQAIANSSPLGVYYSLPYDQVVPTFILKPLMVTSVDVQHHPRQWTPLTPLAMHAAPGLALHQTGRLQRLLDPRITQPDLMVLAELLMKVPHVQIEVLVPI